MGWLLKGKKRVWYLLHDGTLYAFDHEQVFPSLLRSRSDILPELFLELFCGLHFDNLPPVIVDHWQDPRSDFKKQVSESIKLLLCEVKDGGENHIDIYGKPLSLSLYFSLSERVHTRTSYEGVVFLLCVGEYCVFLTLLDILTKKSPYRVTALSKVRKSIFFSFREKKAHDLIGVCRKTSRPG